MLNHARKGRGEPLLLHGIGSHWQMWAPLLDRLVAERDVPAVDPPGFGRSAALGRERAYRAAVLWSSRAPARGLGRALDPPHRRATGRTLTMSHLIGRPWRMPGGARHPRHARLRGCGHVPAWDDPAGVAAVLPAGSGSV